MDDNLKTAWWSLKLALFLGPFLAGLDKFFHLLAELGHVFESYGAEDTGRSEPSFYAGRRSRRDDRGPDDHHSLDKTRSVHCEYLAAADCHQSADDRTLLRYRVARCWLMPERVWTGEAD